MTIRALLEQGHSKAVTDEVIGYVGNDPARFSELMNELINGSPIMRQRAAWPMSYILQYHPHLAEPYWKDLLSLAENKKLHIAVQRNVLRAWQYMDSFPADLTGRILDICYTILLNKSANVANRAFAMTVIYRICKKYPELKAELRAALEDILENEEGAGVRSRAKNVLKQIS